METEKDSEESTLSAEAFMREWHTSNAVFLYQKFKIDKGLRQLGIDPRTIKRPPGRPLKFKVANIGGKAIVMWKDDEIVQLVYKQMWQAGKPFSNANGSDLNECFYRVADAWGMHPREVRRKFEAVPIVRRKQIERFLVQKLSEHNAIHAKKKKSAERLLKKKKEG